MKSESCGPRSVHWSDLHRILIDALPPQARVRFGHTVTDLRETGDGVVATVRVKAAPGADGEARTEEFAGDLAVAADGQMSETRRRHVGDERRSAC